MKAEKVLFKQVAIVGVGELGASIGLALKKRGAVKEVVGIGRQETKSLAIAKKIGAVDKTTFITDIARGVKDADLIVLATPVLKIVELGKKVALHCKAGAIVTDVGSTKKVIVEALEGIMPKGARFVGSHPMAGTEKGGPRNASATLFTDRDCFLTETSGTDPDALTKLKRFWKRLGARTVIIMDPAEHDRIVARTSQMVHLVASSLVLSNKDMLQYTASGFRDTTRIAKAEAKLWQDVCMTNSEEIATSLAELIAILKDFEAALLRKDGVRIARLLAKAKKYREEL